MNQSYGKNEYIISTLYGSINITESVLIELIHSQGVQRLKKINQYGTMYFVKPGQLYTRYEHSLGVLFLLRQYGASLEEQVAGLLHDVSHTAFSHVTDYLFETVCCKDSYQDQIFEEFVSNTDILPILQKYSLEWICPLDARAKFTMLKNSLPNVCVDRLEYNLYGAYIEGWLTKQEIINILNCLNYSNNMFLFTELKAAKTFAMISINLSREIWCAAWNGFLFTRSAYVLKRALDINLITINDLMYSVDDEVWNCLNSSHDSEILYTLEQMKNYDNHFKVSSEKDYNLFIKGKFRGIDPFVSTKNGIKLLSECEDSFKSALEEAKYTLNQGWYIQYW